MEVTDPRRGAGAMRSIASSFSAGFQPLGSLKRKLPKLIYGVSCPASPMGGTSNDRRSNAHLLEFEIFIGLSLAH
jgi:hypothetical protein